MLFDPYFGLLLASQKEKDRLTLRIWEEEVSVEKICVSVSVSVCAVPF